MNRGDSTVILRSDEPGDLPARVLRSRLLSAPLIAKNLRDQRFVARLAPASSGEEYLSRP